MNLVVLIIIIVMNGMASEKRIATSGVDTLELCQEVGKQELANVMRNPDVTSAGYTCAVVKVGSKS